MGGAKMLDHRHFGEFVGDQKRVRKDGGVLAVEPVENLNRQLHFHAARHVNESAGTDEGLVERGELRRPERGWLRHEMPAEQIFVLEQGSFERHQDHAALSERFRQRIAPEQLIVRKNKPAGDGIEADGAFEDFIALALRQQALGCA